MMLVEEDKVPVAVVPGTVIVFQVGVGPWIQLTSLTSLATVGRVMVLNKKKLAMIKE